MDQFLKLTKARQRNHTEGRPKRRKRKSKSKSRKKLHDYSQADSKFRAQSTTSGNRNSRPVKYTDLYSIYRKNASSSSINNIEDYSMDKEEFGQTHRSRSEGSTRNEKPKA